MGEGLPRLVPVEEPMKIPKVNRYELELLHQIRLRAVTEGGLTLAEERCELLTESVACDAARDTMADSDDGHLLLLREAMQHALDALDDVLAKRPNESWEDALEPLARVVEAGRRPE
jgi:hypothetical protein